MYLPLGKQERLVPGRNAGCQRAKEMIESAFPFLQNSERGPREILMIRASWDLDAGPLNQTVTGRSQSDVEGNRSPTPMNMEKTHNLFVGLFRDRFTAVSIFCLCQEPFTTTPRMYTACQTSTTPLTPKLGQQPASTIKTIYLSSSVQIWM